MLPSKIVFNICCCKKVQKILFLLFSASPLVWQQVIEMQFFSFSHVLCQLGSYLLSQLGGKAFNQRGKGRGIHPGIGLKLVLTLVEMEQIPDDMVPLIQGYHALVLKPAGSSGRMPRTAKGSGAGPVSFCGTEILLQQFKSLEGLNQKPTSDLLMYWVRKHRSELSPHWFRC